MNYSTKVHTSGGRNTLEINIDGEEVSIDGLAVHEYHYEEGGNRVNDSLMLFSDDMEIQLDLEENAIREHFGHGDVRIHLPEELVDEIQRKLENSVQEWSAR